MRGAREHESKGLEKFLKKVLDKESAVWYNRDPTAKRCVPCKLNNVKKKHEAPEEDRVLFSREIGKGPRRNFFEAWKSFNKMIWTSWIACTDTILLRV